MVTGWWTKATLVLAQHHGGGLGRRARDAEQCNLGLGRQSGPVCQHRLLRLKEEAVRVLQP